MSLILDGLNITGPFQARMAQYKRTFEIHEKFVEECPGGITIIESLPDRSKTVPIHFQDDYRDGNRWKLYVKKLSLKKREREFFLGRAQDTVDQLLRTSNPWDLLLINVSGNKPAKKGEIPITIKDSPRTVIIGENQGTISLTDCPDSFIYKGGKIIGNESKELTLFKVSDFFSEQSPETVGSSSIGCKAIQTFKPQFIDSTNATTKRGKLVTLEKCKGTTADDCEIVEIKGDQEGKLFRGVTNRVWFAMFRATPKPLVIDCTVAPNSNGNLPHRHAT